MPWKERTVEDLRREFVEAAKGCANLSALCREFGISRPTGYKWLTRATAGEPLADRSHAPKRVPGRTPEVLEALILAERTANPAWGGKTIRQVLVNQGQTELPCARTVQNILRRNGYISPEEAQKHKPFIRFEKANCNEMWQTDFKGDFGLGDGSRCHPLTILDDHSRYCLHIGAKSNTQGVMESFRNVFEEYGLPNAILSDNGAQFAGFRHGYTQFEKWLMQHDVLPIHGRIKHPQTQGKIERFHRTMKTELLNHVSFADLGDADIALQDWRNRYNTVRPHEALGMRCPATVYEASNRDYVDAYPKHTYGGQYHVIKVNSCGYVRSGRFQAYLSETMCGEYIEFRPSADGKTFAVCFRNYQIATFDADSGNRLNRRITRLDV